METFLVHEVVFSIYGFIPRLELLLAQQEGWEPGLDHTSILFIES